MYLKHTNINPLTTKCRFALFKFQEIFQKNSVPCVVCIGAEGPACSASLLNPLGAAWVEEEGDEEYWEEEEEEEELSAKSIVSPVVGALRC